MPNHYQMMKSHFKEDAMSEFICSNGHVTKPGVKCDECGARITRMDGMTEEQFRAEEGFLTKRDFGRGE